VRALFPGADLGALTADAARVRDVPLCYPLVGHGERFPFVAPQASGFLGDGPLTGDSATVFAAVCTGVAHVERLSFELLASAGADVGGPSRPPAARATSGGTSCGATCWVYRCGSR
jgi:sugar (pentulose or hexulose) kinase